MAHRSSRVFPENSVGASVPTSHSQRKRIQRDRVAHCEGKTKELWALLISKRRMQRSGESLLAEVQVNIFFYPIHAFHLVL